MKELTKSEEEVMQILWKIKKGFVKDVMEYFAEPKPAYNTVSTIIRILETKNFVSHKAYGKTYEYFPLVAKDEYKKFYLRTMMKNYFNNSFQELVSFFSKENKMTVSEIEEVIGLLKDEVHKK
ncbi:MAG: BlaI/MecI/CopY family transcriptional regulator [Bacteroidota bacterium]|nr:BlaI/MecI/CopY family transcriptional regulator [Bacteroidota bacterium]MDP4228359.1 BlaI/MecI/CopY family transcriptional regulator [Bacteroidota bacterium]